MAAVLGAALLHATWNSIAHAVGDRLLGFAVMGVVDVAVGAVLVAAAGSARGAWPYVATSAALHAAYGLLLLASYHRRAVAAAVVLAGVVAVSLPG